MPVRAWRRMRGLALMAVGLAGAALLISCGSEEPAPGPRAAAFARWLQEQQQALAAELAPALERKDPAAIQAVLARAFRRAAARGRPLPGVGVLDAEGVYLAGRYQEPGRPRGVADRDTHRDYGNYRMIKQVREGAAAATGKVYFPEGPAYLAAFALRRGGRLLGVLVFAFEARDLKHLGGITPREFLALKLAP